MKRLLYALVAVFAVACVEDQITEVRPDMAQAPRIYAALSDDTRVELNDDKKTVWSALDELYVVSASYEATYRFIGNTGDRKGIFEQLENSENYRWSDLGDYAYAMYPLSAYYSTGNYTSNPTYPLPFMTFNRVQNYKEGSYDPACNFMVGQSEDGVNFKFKNLVSYLRLSLTGEKRVRSITVQSNNNEYLAGVLYFELLDTDVWAWYSDSSTEITLDCGEDGVQLTDSPKDFYIALMPMILSNGLYVEIEFTDGTTYHKATFNELVFERNTIKPMVTLDTAEDIAWERVKIYHTGESIADPIMYGTSIGTIDWGDGNVTDVVEAFMPYIFKDGEDEHVIEIKTLYSTEIHIPSCEGVTRLDFSEYFVNATRTN